VATLDQGSPDPYLAREARAASLSTTSGSAGR
jgi:hypothetical protein